MCMVGLPSWGLDDEEEQSRDSVYVCVGLYWYVGVEEVEEGNKSGVA